MGGAVSQTLTPGDDRTSTQMLTDSLAALDSWRTHQADAQRARTTRPSRLHRKEHNDGVR